MGKRPKWQAGKSKRWKESLANGVVHACPFLTFLGKRLAVVHCYCYCYPLVFFPVWVIPGGLPRLLCLPLLSRILGSFGASFFSLLSSTRRNSSYSVSTQSTPFTLFLFNNTDAAHRHCSCHAIDWPPLIRTPPGVVCVAMSAGQRHPVSRQESQRQKVKTKRSKRRQDTSVTLGAFLSLVHRLIWRGFRTQIY